MKIGQLLAAGRSLVGQKDQVGRYRPVDPRSMPRFEQGTPEWLSAGAEAPQAEPQHAAPCAPAEPPAVKPAPFPGPVCRADLPKRHGLWTRIWAAVWPGQKAAGPRPAGVRRPIQAELRLEQVKVVRNDLSDADLEVVRSQAPAAAAPELKGTTLQEKPAKSSRPGTLSVMRILS